MTRTDLKGCAFAVLICGSVLGAGYLGHLNARRACMERADGLPWRQDGSFGCLIKVNGFWANPERVVVLRQ